MQLIVALLLLEAYGLTAVEILLTVCGVQCLFVACQGFPEQIIQQAPRPAGCSDSEKACLCFFGQEDTRHLCECVVSSARASLCSSVLLCTPGERGVCVIL